MCPLCRQAVIDCYKLVKRVYTNTSLDATIVFDQNPYLCQLLQYQQNIRITSYVQMKIINSSMFFVSFSAKYVAAKS